MVNFHGMGYYIRKVLNLQEGEGTRVLLFALLGFLWAWGTSMALRFADASFLLHIGAASLPKVYTITALGLMFISAILLWAYHKYSPFQIFTTALVIEILFFTGVYYCLTTATLTESHSFWYALRIFCYFFLTLNLTGFWTFIDQYQHVQDSKRMYGLFTSMVFLGRVSTGTVMQSDLLNLEEITLLVMTLLFIALIWVVWIEKRLPLAHDELEMINHTTPSENTLSFLFQSIINSKFTLILMLSNVLTFVLWVTTEFNYLSAFDNYFDPGTTTEVGTEQSAALTHFLGRCLMYTSIFNLIFGLLIYSRLVRKVGITGVLFGTSLIFLTAYSGWQFDTTLLFPVFGYLIVEGMLDVVDDSNFNLLLHAVPQKVKYKIRVTIESFVEPIGMLISGLILYNELISGKVIGLILSILLLITAIGLRRSYLPAIYQNLTSSTLRLQRTLKKWFQKMPEKMRKSNEYRLFGLLRSGEPERQIFALKGLIASGDLTILHKLVKHLENITHEVQTEAIPLLSEGPFSECQEILSIFHDWANSPFANISGPSLLALARDNHLPHDLATSLQKEASTYETVAAIMEMKRDPSKKLQSDVLLSHLLNLGKEDELVIAIEALGVCPSEADIVTLINFIRDGTPDIALAAAKTLLRTSSSSLRGYAPFLVHALSNREESAIRIKALDILRKMEAVDFVKEIVRAAEFFRPMEIRHAINVLRSFGVYAVPSLLSRVKDTTLPAKSRLLAGRALGKIDPEKLRGDLYDIIHTEVDRVKAYADAAANFSDQREDENFLLLEETLLSGFHSVLDFIIQLLGAAGEVEDCELLSELMRSRNIKVRSQALEALEKSCEHRIFHILLPLITEKGLTSREARNEITTTQLLNTMLQSPSQLDRLVAVVLKHRWSIPGWKEDLTLLLETQNPLFHHFARDILH